MEQSLFPPDTQQQVKRCVRCGIRCRVVEKANRQAEVFVRGDAETGLFCANCLVVDFFLNFDLGPISALDESFFRKPDTLPDCREELAHYKPIFNPDCLRLPHIQEQFGRIVAAASAQHGAELSAEEIDWDAVIANWHLPFPVKPKRKKP